MARISISIAVAALLMLGISSASTGHAAATRNSAGNRSASAAQQSASDDLDQALAVELGLHPGAFVAPEGFACASDANPDARTCIFIKSTLDQIQRGIAVFDFLEPGSGGAKEVVARDTAGNWDFWFGTQQSVHQLLYLPDAVMVCTNRDALNLHSAPSVDASLVGALSDGVTATADEFLLAPDLRDTAGRPINPAYGWYHVTSPVDGWALSLYLSDARLPDCTLHDAITAPR